MSEMQQLVERNVRMLIGDLHMQVIILQAQIETAQRAAAAEAPAKHNGAREPAQKEASP